MENEPLVLPMLFKLDSKGVERCWRTWTVDNGDGTATEMNESGVVGGKLSGIPIVVSTGTNIGRSNETTPLQQANKRITSKYTAKLKGGYVQDLEEFSHKGVMKAHEWRVSKHRMPATALSQPKIDGIRGKISTDGVIMSKSNTEFKPYLKELPWARYAASKLSEGQEADGEMYIHGLELNEIASLVMSYKYNTEEFRSYCVDTEDGLLIKLSSKEILDHIHVGEFQPEQDGSNTAGQYDILGPTEVREGRKRIGWLFPFHSVEDVRTVGTSELEFWAFDIAEEGVCAEERNHNLSEMYDDQEAVDNGIIALVAEEFSIEDIEEVNSAYVEAGHEGTIVRNPAGMYAYGERTADLQKYKLSFDAEWVITGYTIDRQGNPNFTFESDMGDLFESRPRGTRAWRVRILSDMDALIGRRATIRYQKLYADTMKPQFSRVIAIRDYE